MARNDIVRILLILGAIVAIIEGVWALLHLGGSGEGLILDIAFAIGVIVIGVILLGSVGAIHTKHKISVGHWLIMIILGIVLYFLHATYGGIIVIIAGIVALVLSL